MTDIVQQVTTVTVDVTSTSLTIASTPAPTVMVAAAGPQGPSGAGGSTSFEFTQTSPSASWVIVHGLRKYPSVTLVNDAGQIVYADIEYSDLNTVSVTFANPQVGTAYLV